MNVVAPFVEERASKLTFPLPFLCVRSSNQQYLIMLIAMTFNGYIIIAIVLGGIFGHFFSTWDTLGSSHLVDLDDGLGHGFPSDGGVAAAPKEAVVSPCCQNGASKDSASDSSSSDDENHLKRHVVTLPDHGYGSGACCV